MRDELEIVRLRSQWTDDTRWRGVQREYTPEEVVRLRPKNFPVGNQLAGNASRKLWSLLKRKEREEKPSYVHALGALSGQQAVQMAKAGLEAIYVSGWQVAADANTAGETYPDQSLYPVDSVPMLVRKINNALRRADQIESIEGKTTRDWLVPLVADAEAGFGGPLNAYELMLHLIEAGAAAVHFEDQYSPAKKCGHMGGKVLLSTSQAIDNLKAARLAADVAEVPTILVARTDANSATLLLSDHDEQDGLFAGKQRTREGYFLLTGTGLERAIARGLAYAPYADMLWCETSTPDLKEAEQFAESIHQRFPEKLLAYNCSPSFNWKKHLDEKTIAMFQKELAAMGYKFQFVTLAGFHANNLAVFALASEYKGKDMAAYANLQEREFAWEKEGYEAVKHQHEVGTGYFDEISRIISGGKSSTLAMEGSTEEGQF